MLKPVYLFLTLLFTFIISCSDGNNNVNVVEPDKKPVPTDYEEQPEYLGQPVSFYQDTDGDKVCDYADLFPQDDKRSLPLIVTEQEFNNNISQANDISNSNNFPIIITGSLSEGNDFYLDNDVFKFYGNKGERISVIVINGSMNQDSSGMEILFPEKMLDFNVSILDASGNRLSGLTIGENSRTGIKGVGVELPVTGNFYVEVSNTQITSKGYSYPYVVIIQRDKDFDGLGDALEEVIGSNLNVIDTDRDGIADLDEVFAFLKSKGGLINQCENISQNQTDIDWWDVDKDGIPNWYDVDSDGDGPPDRIEGIEDTDLDTIPNFLDVDSNQNGVLDSDEAGESFQYPSDSDGDGVYDFADVDIDNDGIPNSIDKDIRTPLKPNYVFGENALYARYAYTEIEGNVLRNIAIIGYDLKIYTSNLTSDVYVILPIRYGTTAVKPKDINLDKGFVTVEIPPNIVSGNIYIYDRNKNRLSNSIWIEAKDIDKDPILYPLPLDKIYSPGDTVTLSGRNLSSGDITIIITDGVKTVSITGKSNGNTVQFTVPSNAISGLLYIQVGSIESNKIDFTVNRTVNVTIQLPAGLNVENTEISLLREGRVYTFDNTFSSNIPVENNTIDFISVSVEKDINGDGKAEILPFYEGIVLPNQTNLVLNSKSTAVKWMFFIVGYHITEPPSKWESIISSIENTPEVDALADYIDQLLIYDISALASFDDPELKQKYKEALQATVINVSNTLSSASVEPEIRPSDNQYDISLSPNGIDIKLFNDTKLFLSVKAETTDGTIIREHITYPWDKNIVGPQGGGLLFIAEEADIKVSGRDSVIDVITGGIADPRQNIDAYKYVLSRTIFDGIVYPPLNEIVFKKLFGRSFRSEEVAGLILEVSRSSFDFFMAEIYSDPTPSGIYSSIKNNIFEPFKFAFKNCLQLPPGDTCRSMISFVSTITGVDEDKLLTLVAGRVGEEIISRLTPVLGQIELALDVLGYANTAAGVFVTIHDLTSTPGYIQFEVDFPLEINDVQPACISKNNVTDSFSLNIEGKGFSPYSTGYLWWKKKVYPEVYLGDVKGKVLSVSNDGIKMKVAFEIDKVEDGEHILKVNHQGQDVQYDTPIQIFGESIIKITQIDPSKGQPGDIVTIYGCGFSSDPTQNEVYFTGSDGNPVKGTVMGAGEGYLQVKVPENAVTGDVYVQVKDAVSNSLPFVVEKSDIVITFGDCGPANDDTFALYVDGNLVYSMPAPSRPFDVSVNISIGRHEVQLVGITAPDDIGTYCIEFSNNVKIISGPPTSGEDLTAGVIKTWLIEVLSNPVSQGVEKLSIPILPMKE